MTWSMPCTFLTGNFNKHCLVDSKIWHANSAVSLNGYWWAVSLLVTEKIQIWCLSETHKLKNPTTDHYICRVMDMKLQQ